MEINLLLEYYISENMRTEEDIFPNRNFTSQGLLKDKWLSCLNLILAKHSRQLGNKFLISSSYLIPFSKVLGYIPKRISQLIPTKET